MGQPVPRNRSARKSWLVFPGCVLDAVWQRLSCDPPGLSVKQIVPAHAQSQPQFAQAAAKYACRNLFGLKLKQGVGRSGGP